jgi:hypothetical protein
MLRGLLEGSQLNRLDGDYLGTLCAAVVASRGVGWVNSLLRKISNGSPKSDEFTDMEIERRNFLPPAAAYHYLSKGPHGSPLSVYVQSGKCS